MLCNQHISCTITSCNLRLFVHNNFLQPATNCTITFCCLAGNHTITFCGLASNCPITYCGLATNCTITFCGMGINCTITCRGHYIFIQGPTIPSILTGEEGVPPARIFNAGKCVSYSQHMMLASRVEIFIHF